MYRNLEKAHRSLRFHSPRHQRFNVVGQGYRIGGTILLQSCAIFDADDLALIDSMSGFRPAARRLDCSMPNGWDPLGNEVGMWDANYSYANTLDTINGKISPQLPSIEDLYG